MSDQTTHFLHCHPTARCAAVSSIEVAVALSREGGLKLHYVVRAAPGSLRIPSPRPTGAADGLWQRTCCEAFIGAGEAPGYREFNFSPSGQWAVYDFSGYRQRDDAFHPPLAPRVAFRPASDGFALSAGLAPALLPVGDTLQLGFSAVLEAADGSKTYWALRHCAAQPDFHLRQSFSLTLKADQP